MYFFCAKFLCVVMGFFFLRNIIFERGRSRKCCVLESMLRLPVIGSFNYINSDNESYTYFLLDFMSMLCIYLPFQRQLQSPDFWDSDRKTTTSEFQCKEEVGD